MPRNIACIKKELEEAVARIPSTPADPIEAYFRYEETAAAINDALAYQEFVTRDEVPSRDGKRVQLQKANFDLDSIRGIFLGRRQAVT